MVDSAGVKPAVTDEGPQPSLAASHLRSLVWVAWQGSERDRERERAAAFHRGSRSSKLESTPTPPCINLEELTILLVTGTFWAFSRDLAKGSIPLQRWVVGSSDPPSRCCTSSSLWQESFLSVCPKHDIRHVGPALFQIGALVV